MASVRSEMAVHRAPSAAYTVICKSGQRGTEFSDPVAAAQAFLLARTLDRPFVLRHQGGATVVIASAKAGTKRIEPGWSDDGFRLAYESASIKLPAT